MTKQQFDDLYLGKVVHCDTVEKAKAFLSLAKSFGHTWASGANLEEYIRWDNNKENTCYRLSDNGVVTDHKSYYTDNSYEVVEFKQEKENNMMFKIGDKVRVKSGLRKGQLLGINLDTYHKKLENNVFTISSVTGGGNYDVEETGYILSDEMLEPVAEFNVGDVVYNKDGCKAKIVDISFLIEYEKSGARFYKAKNELSKTKPLEKITRKELAEKGYELVD